MAGTEVATTSGKVGWAFSDAPGIPRRKMPWYRSAPLRIRDWYLEYFMPSKDGKHTVCRQPWEEHGPGGQCPKVQPQRVIARREEKGGKT